MAVNGYKIKPFSNLSGADLYGANLSGANLYGANLSGANLYGANLSGANLRGPNLREADLSGPNLREADLSGPNLREADLSEANLYGANLRGANLRRANLSGANLYGANLRRANLSGADLYGANLSGVSGLHFQIPEGDLLVWKKGSGGTLIKLKIPSGAKRTSCITGRKCRAEYAEVLDILLNGKRIKSCKGWYDEGFIYRIGEVVKPDKYCNDARLECSNGIHFFLTREEAEDF